MTGLEHYIYNNITSRYADFDTAHREDHVLTVISQAMELLDRMPGWIAGQKALGNDVSQWDVPVRRDILLAAAACEAAENQNQNQCHCECLFHK